MATALVLALLALPTLALDAPAAALDCASHLHDMYVGARSFNLTADYNKHSLPTQNATVSVSVSINRVSAVDENKEEISLDVFLQVHWRDPRVSPAAGQEFAEVPWEQRHILWIPDLYIRQLREMKMQTVFEEMSSMRVYVNGTMRISIGATIIIKCDMDFVLYPLDVQTCAVDFSSYKYTSQELTFTWKNDSPVNYSSKRFRLPRYIVSFTTERERRFVHYGEGNHSAARLLIRLSREIRSYLLESYLPSSLFVIISWGSFCVIPEIVPGRMVLLVTTLLALVTMFDTVRNTSPDALELKSIEVWLISCTIFVFLALMEYFIVLFGIRYDKCWRRRIRPSMSATVLTPTAAVIANHTQTIGRGGGEGGEPGAVCGRNGSRGTAPGVFTQTRIVPSEDDSLKQQLAAQTGREIQRASPIMECTMSQNDDQSSDRSRLFIAVERVILFCGSQRGTMDRFALMIFPMSFSIFAMIYWTSYLSAANKQMRQ